MGCHKPWNRAFLDDHLTKSWREHELREHRGAVIFDRERARLPDTQAAVAVEREKRKAAKELETHTPRLLELRSVYLKANETYRAIESAHWKKKSDAICPPVGEDSVKLQAEADALWEQVREATKERRKARKAFDEYSDSLWPIRRRIADGIVYQAPRALRDLGLGDQPPASLVERGMYTWEQLAEMGIDVIAEQAKIQKRHQFVAACPKEACRGFLSSAYKCGTCEDYFCSKCRTHIGTERDPTHECDPALLATIQAILADSKPCPSCGTAISRVSGCDQMYCTQCDTPFSYKTGERVTSGPIHNPHYFQRMAALGANAPAAADNDPCGDGALRRRFDLVCNNKTVVNTLHENAYKLPMPSMLSLHYLQYTLADVRDRMIVAYPDPRTPPNYEALRVRYMLNDFTEKELKQRLATEDTQRSRDLEIRAILETAVLLLLDTLMSLPYQGDEGPGQALFTLFTGPTVGGDWTMTVRGRVPVKPGPPELKEATETVMSAFAEVLDKTNGRFVRQLEELVNAPLRAIADRYQNIVPIFNINESNQLTTDRYRPSKGKAKGKKAEADIIQHVSPAESVAAGGGH